MRDMKIPALRIGNLPAALSEALIARGLAPPGTMVQVLLVKHKPGKQAVARVRFANGEGGSRLIFKMSRKGRGEGIYQKMRRLWEALQASGQPAFLPEPIAYLPSLDGVLLKQVEGHAFQPEASSAQQRKWLQLAARALTWLHGLPLTNADVFPRREWAYWVNKFARKPGAALAARMSASVKTAWHRVCAHLESAEGVGNEGCDTLCHGDFSPSQLLFRDRHAVILDFDSVCVSWPELDLANFLISLRAHQTHRFPQMALWFLESYGRRGRLSEARMNWAFALALVRRMVIALKHDLANHSQDIQQLELALQLLTGSIDWQQIA